MSVRGWSIALAVLCGSLVASLIVAGDLGRLRGQRADRDLVLRSTTEGWAEAASGIFDTEFGMSILSAELNQPRDHIALLLLDEDGVVIARSAGAETIDASRLELPTDTSQTVIGSLPDSGRSATRHIGPQGQWTIAAIADDADFVTAEDRPAVLVVRWLVVAALIVGLVLLATRPFARRMRALHLRATRDTITGLDNRATITTTLRRALEQDSEPVTVAIIDLDDFKPINDTWGHRVGDDALERVGERLARFAGDHGMHVGRLGGDEFLLVASAERALPEAAAWDHLVDTMIVPFDVHDHEIRIGASVGVVHVLNGDDRTAEHVLGRADRALYGIKRRGGKGWQANTEVIDARSPGQTVDT